MTKKDENLRTFYETQILTCTWNMLEPHHEREALFIVDKNLNLIDVAQAIAEDQVDSVKTWLTDKTLAKPSLEEVQMFSENAQKELGHFLIVQPYVIFQLKE